MEFWIGISWDIHDLSGFSWDFDRIEWDFTSHYGLSITNHKTITGYQGINTKDLDLMPLNQQSCWYTKKTNH